MAQHKAANRGRGRTRGPLRSPARNFVATERGVRFEIALDTADKSNLRLSSRLLSVAQSVRTGAP